jgi:LuxR family maltose regulon positive regulatory protein
MITQARRALEYLPPDNLLSRFRANWTMAMVYIFRGERAAAGRANAEALSIALASGDIHNTILATTFLGQLQELENQLYPAAETYRRVLQLIGDYSPPVASEAYLGLAHICYEWNDLDAAEQHGQQSLQLVRKYDQVIDWFVVNEVFLARLKLAQGDVAGAAGILAQADQSVRKHSFVHRIPDVAAQQVIVLLRQGDLEAAAHLAQTHELPFSLARVHLAQGDSSSALAVLELLRQQMEAKGWQDERLKVMVVQAVAHQAHGEKDKAVQLLGEALALAEPGGFVRIFVDEGVPMAQLLSETAARGIMPDYIGRLLAAFDAEKRKSEDEPDLSPALPALPEGHRDGEPLIEPLSQRELKILQLIAQGLSNREIGERLFLALSTVKGHNRNIFDKLQVLSRTEAVARARELGLL